LAVFIPSLSTREVLAFGEAVGLPARLVFRELPHDLRPRRERDCDERARIEATDEFLAAVGEKWRRASSSGGSQLDLEMSPLGFPDELSAVTPGADLLSAYRSPQIKVSF